MRKRISNQSNDLSTETPLFPTKAFKKSQNFELRIQTKDNLEVLGKTLKYKTPKTKYSIGVIPKTLLKITKKKKSNKIDISSEDFGKMFSLQKCIENRRGIYAAIEDATAEESYILNYIKAMPDKNLVPNFNFRSAITDKCAKLEELNIMNDQAELEFFCESHTTLQAPDNSKASTELRLVDSPVLTEYFYHEFYCLVVSIKYIDLDIRQFVARIKTIGTELNNQVGSTQTKTNEQQPDLRIINTDLQ